MSKHKRIVEITLRHKHGAPRTEVVITRQIGHGMNTEYQEHTHTPNYMRMYDLAQMIKEHVEEHNAELDIDADYKSLAVTMKCY